MAKKMIPSTAPGKTWELSVFKTDGGRVLVMAIEGELDTRDGFETFRYKIDFAGGANGGSRMLRDEHRIARLTAKRAKALLEEAENNMRDRGLIA